VKELLDHEEALALQRISGGLQRLGDELGQQLNYTDTIRDHPLLTTGLSALLGFVGGPLLLPGLERTLKVASRVSSSASLHLLTMPGLILARCSSLASRR
jgi:hypothetical protein